MARVLLIDVDGLIPNIALMKLSTYHKARRDEVGFDIGDPDIIYATCLLKKNRHHIDGLRFFYPTAEIHTGGTGIDLGIRLPDEIERLKPDYDLYPDQIYSMGFTTRGCIRRCSFCVVPEKEGKLKRWQHPKEFHDDRFDTIMLLDNNWLADREWFFETSGWIMDHELNVIEGGMDARLLDDEFAERLSEMKIKVMHFAYDKDSHRKAVERAVGILKRHGINIRHDVEFYVYAEDSSAYDSAVSRCRQLKALGTSAFVMFNIDKRTTQRIDDLRRWANLKWLFWSMDIKDYKKGIGRRY